MNLDIEGGADESPQGESLATAERAEITACDLSPASGSYVAGTQWHGWLGDRTPARQHAAARSITAGRDRSISNQQQTEEFLAATKPDVVIVAAAKVGGIHANNAYPAEFISDNLAIARNTIDAATRPA